MKAGRAACSPQSVQEVQDDNVARYERAREGRPLGVLDRQLQRVHGAALHREITCSVSHKPRQPAAGGRVRYWRVLASP